MLDRILLDVETQRDFFLPEGGCYVPQAEEVSRRILRLFDWVRENRIPVMSTALRVRRFERGPLACPGAYCVEGTEGEKKVAWTVLPHRIDMGLRNSTDLPLDIFEMYQQVIFEKRDSDIFAHARAERLITELPMTTTFFLCGAGVSGGIVQAAVGLRSRGFPVVLVRDAVLELEGEKTEMAYLRMEAKGVVFADTEEIVAPRLQRAKPFRLAHRQRAGKSA